MKLLKKLITLTISNTISKIVSAIIFAYFFSSTFLLHKIIKFMQTNEIINYIILFLILPTGFILIASNIYLVKKVRSLKNKLQVLLLKNKLQALNEEPKIDESTGLLKKGNQYFCPACKNVPLSKYIQPHNNAHGYICPKCQGTWIFAALQNLSKT